MQHRWIILVMVLAALAALTGSALGAGWYANGDGTNWFDNMNWNPTNAVPLTGGDAQNAVNIESHHATGTGDVICVLDAATADTFFQDGVYNNNGNFFNVQSRVQASNRAVNVFLDWGASYTNNGTQLGTGSTTNGAINVTQTGGQLILTGAAQLGRGAQPGQNILYDLQGGELNPKLIEVGRGDGDGNVTLKIGPGTVFDQWAPFTYLSQRFATGGIDGGTSTVAIAGDAVVRLFDVRLDSIGANTNLGTGGYSYFKVIGSEADIMFTHNFNSDQDNKPNLANEVQFIADAGGVSTISSLLWTNGTPSSPAFRPSALTTLRVDLTGYAGTDDLVLFRYNRWVGSSFGNVIIEDPLNRGYVLAMDDGPTYEFLEDYLRMYLTIPKLTGMSVSGGVASLTFSGPTSTSQVYKLEASTDLNDAGAWSPTGQEVTGTGSNVVFTDSADAAFEAYRVTD